MFQCDKCGECCRHLNLSSLYHFLDRGDGVCRYLSGNLCTVYEKRPLLCRVDESYEAYFRESMTKNDYYELNYKACDKIKTKNK
ncbi:MAG: YkgJ family cysteine cluster protein [Lachnospiraceae bacterium]|nr:YkgJ family cysteine cluster protein [Lachnospiraceae bacterium]